ncbi:hypothetical protein ATANTOWER_020994, partial [Ataeniobius toweri]|nr:hypothetical protein [Ataeniobius toweri]
QQHTRVRQESGSLLWHSTGGLRLSENRQSGEEGRRRIRARERQRALCHTGENKAKKIENQEKRTLTGEKRSGVLWRRGEKGRRFMTMSDKYGAMHHASNMGRTKTLSHETAVRVRCCAPLVTTFRLTIAMTDRRA